jgi:hypothetical protein
MDSAAQDPEMAGDGREMLIAGANLIIGGYGHYGDRECQERKRAEPCGSWM